MECDRYCATSSRIVRSLKAPRGAWQPLSRRGGLGARPEIRAEIVGHQIDLFRRPQPAAADHAIDRGLPAAAVLPPVAEHRIGVALEALAHHHVATRVLR